ncbi:MAG: hypothetical protein L0229_25165 [Blastocatellia bacterium]|nr:hypothetical protein [Blastocatellia bacterium]
MFRILIVEDIEETRKALQSLLSEAFPNSLIDTSATVAEAHEFLEVIRKKELLYHAIILDFKLPKEKIGAHAEIDESLCLAVRDMAPSSLVIHITAHPDDELVERHLRRVHEEQIDPRSLTLPKEGSNWPIQLLKKLKAFLYGIPIEERINSLFGINSMAATAARNRIERERPKSWSEGSITHELAALCRDIVTHWNDLDESLQATIKTIFYVDAESDPIRVSLLPVTKE